VAWTYVHPSNDHVLQVHEVDTIPDVERRNLDDGELYCFSDGVGRMSPDVARSIGRRMWELGRMKQGSIPCAAQICFNGCKGMLTLDPCLCGNKCAQVQFSAPGLLFSVVLIGTSWEMYLQAC
jgi:hypothetical protein